MAAPQLARALHPALLSRMEEARARSDALFRLLPPNSFYDRPVAERHRLIFYLGHLETFDWNLLNGALGLEAHEAAFDKLFAFGIDPVGGGLPSDTPGDWPGIARVEKYCRSTRERLNAALRDARVVSGSADAYLGDGTLLHVAIEHRLMHAETLSYLLHNLPLERRIPQPATHTDPRPAPDQRWMTIPAGTATLGKLRSDGTFGWDNEFETQQISVPEFSIGAFPVTNGEYMEFV